MPIVVRLLWPPGISAAQSQALTKVSKAVASLQLSSLLKKDYIERLLDSGRSTSTGAEINSLWS